jgi:hypothetical protein
MFAKFFIKKKVKTKMSDRSVAESSCLQKPLLLEMQSREGKLEEKESLDLGNPGVEYYFNIIYTALKQLWVVRRENVDYTKDFKRELMYFNNRDRSAVMNVLQTHMINSQMYRDIDTELKKFPYDAHAFCVLLAPFVCARSRTVPSLAGGLQLYLASNSSGHGPDPLLQIFFMYISQMKRKCSIRNLKPSRYLQDDRQSVIDLSM